MGNQCNIYKQNNNGKLDKIGNRNKPCKASK